MTPEAILEISMHEKSMRSKVQVALATRHIKALNKDETMLLKYLLLFQFAKPMTTAVTRTHWIGFCSFSFQTGNWDTFYMICGATENDLFDDKP